jgi:hypothetical protein
MPPVTPPPPNEVQRGPRPATVTAACALVAAVVVATVISFLLLLANVDRVVSVAVRDAAKQPGTEGVDLESFVRVTVLGSGVVSLVAAALVGVFALLALRGRNWARITTVVLAILWALFSLVGVAGSLVNPTEGLPGGYTTASLIIGVVQLLASAGAAVLLLLPASGAWYARR